MLSLTAQPGYLLIPARTDTTPCEYLSLDTMEKWIICNKHIKIFFCLLNFKCYKNL